MMDRLTHTDLHQYEIKRFPINGWPDPAWLGLPLNSHQTAWHWVSIESIGQWEQKPMHWDAFWKVWSGHGQHTLSVKEAGKRLIYLGECPSPERVTEINEYIENLEKQAAKALSDRDAINDALAEARIALQGKTESSKNAINRLIKRTIKQAIDPRTSKPVADLVFAAEQKGKNETLKKAIAYFEELADKHTTISDTQEDNGERSRHQKLAASYLNYADALGILLTGWPERFS